MQASYTAGTCISRTDHNAIRISRKLPIPFFVLALTDRFTSLRIYRSEGVNPLPDLLDQRVTFRRFQTIHPAPASNTKTTVEGSGIAEMVV